MGPEDPALIVFTSGTTGEPRGVVHAYRYLLGQKGQAEHWFGSRKGELAWCTTATGWSKSARNVFLAPWLTGAAAVIHDGRFDPAERLDFVEALGSTSSARRRPSTGCSPSAHALRPLPSLRRMVSAGEPLEPETIAAFREATGLEPADGYGQTETGHISGNLAGEPVREGSMGRPLPGIEIRIVEGELQLRAASSPTFFSRYLDGERFEGEWWPTGDLVREDEDGYLYFEGRDDDIILSSGYRIGPFEVESALLSHPAVAEAAAVAAPDPERGASCGRSSSRASASRVRSWPASCRSTASARRRPTSSRASSSSPPSCRRRQRQDQARPATRQPIALSHRAASQRARPTDRALAQPPPARRRGPVGLGGGRGVAQVPLGVEGALAAAAGRRDGLAVGVVDHVADGEDALQVGAGRAGLGEDVAVLVGVDLVGDHLGAGDVADRDEGAVGLEVLALTGLDVAQAHVVEAAVVAGDELLRHVGRLEADLACSCGPLEA